MDFQDSGLPPGFVLDPPNPRPVQPRPMPPQQQGGYGRIVTGGPRVAPPVAPSQAVQDYAGAANANASANRTQALTPAEVEQARLQAAATRRDLEQGVSSQQVNQNDLARQRADIEAMTNQLMNVGNLYNRNFRDNDPIVTLGLSPTEREFDRNAEILRQQAQTAFRTPGIGSQSDFEARQMEQAYGLSSTNWDTENEAVLNGLTNRLNERRRALGLDPIDWRQSNVQAVQNADPNRVQPGESMGQVGTVPNPAMATDPGSNQLDNAGGMYVTSQDRQQGDIIARTATEIAQRTGNPETVSNFLRRMGRPPLDVNQTRTLNSFRRRNQLQRFPGYSPTYVPTGRSDPNLTTGVANSPVGAAVIAGGDALSMGTLDNFTADPERTRAGMEMLREQHPWESAAGEAVGSLVPGAALERGVGYGLRALNEARGVGNVARGAGEMATIGEMATRPAGNFAYGAGYGAGSADQPGDNRLMAALRGGALSAAGGEVGDRVVGGVGRALTGSRNAAVRALTERGVPLSIGQIASGGGRLARVATSVENALESVPWLGDAIRARRQDSFNGVNRAAFDEALAPIGANTGGVVGEEGAGLARSAVSDAYSNALDNVRVNAARDPSFEKEMRGVISVGQRLPADLQGHFRNFVENRVAHELADGTLTGAGYQALRQEIRQEVASVSGQLGERAYGAAMKRLGNTLEGLVRRNAPKAIPALNAADRAYRQTRVVEGAVGRALNNKEQGGVFTPAQLGMEARANANRFGNNGGTTNRPFYQLQRDAQNTLPSSLPNSGTTDRAWVLAAFPAIVSGGLGATGVIDPGTAALFAGLGLPYTRAGQRSFQKLLVSRPDAVRRAGEAIIAQRRWGGRAGAGAVNPITDQTPNPSGR